MLLVMTSNCRMQAARVTLCAEPESRRMILQRPFRRPMLYTS